MILQFYDFWFFSKDFPYKKIVGFFLVGMWEDFWSSPIFEGCENYWKFSKLKFFKLRKLSSTRKSLIIGYSKTEIFPEKQRFFQKDRILSLKNKNKNNKNVGLFQT